MTHNPVLSLDQAQFVPHDAAAREALLAAAAEVRECYRVLVKGGLNVVGEVLRGEGTFFQMQHYPADDVYDRDSHGQYYYHAHRGGKGEHGHFHTFMRGKGMPPACVAQPYAQPSRAQWPVDAEAISHLIAVSMDAYGYPMGLFACNRWVTGETWYSASDVISMLDGFAIDHAKPSWPVNRWLTALLRLYRPQIEYLLQHRDQVIAQAQAAQPSVDVLEDRQLEITGYLPINVDSWTALLNTSLPQSA